MDAQMVLNIFSLVVSLVALTLATRLTRGQTRVQREANFMPVLTGLLDVFRTRRFHDDYEYLCRRLANENDPANGISGLSDRGHEAFYSVVYLYQQFAMLVDLGILEYDRVATVAGHRMAEIWNAIEPFVLVERESSTSSGSGFRYFEAFVRRYSAREAKQSR